MIPDAARIRTVAQILRDAAQSIVLPRFRDLAAGDIRQKSSHLDLVTDADVAAEAQITAQLRAAFPGALVVGEEASAEDPTILDGLGDAELAFVIDPIDGTKNFASGLPLFALMVAVLARGRTVAGVIHDPIVDDYAAAIAGGGAWVERPDGRRTALRVGRPRPIGEMLGIVSWMFMAEPMRSTVTRNLAHFAGAADYRTAAHEYRLLAAGHYDFAVFRKLAPWDHLAGVLLHQEAGGYAACLDGSPYTHAAYADGTEGLLCAPDAESWAALRTTLFGA
jgi:fructose-1,6-bisphosphatase/inositol monophosphatase family enzyme